MCSETLIDVHKTFKHVQKRQHIFKTFANSSKIFKNKRLNDFRNKPTPPPPLPPHGISQTEKQKEIKKQDTIEEYKPPVPPHRNIASVAGPPSNSVEASPTRKHHHHHHHRNTRPQIENGAKAKYEGRPQPPEYTNRYSSRNDDIVVECEPQEPPKRSVFEFDDDLPPVVASPAVNNCGAEQQQSPPPVIAKASNNNEEDAQFVQYVKSPTRNNVNRK